MVTIEMRLLTIQSEVSELKKSENEMAQILLGDKLETFANLLKIYEAKDENGKIKLLRLGKDYDGSYIVAEKSLKSADVLFGYGIANDISF